MRWVRWILCATVLCGVSLLVFGCSLGSGTGAVHSDVLYAKDCWCSTYDLVPRFFAAVPYRDTIQMRVQRGTDITEISDGLSILVTHVSDIRRLYLGKKLKVALPIGIEPPGREPPSGDAGVLLPAEDAGTPYTGCVPRDDSVGLGACNMALLPPGDPVDEGPAMVNMSLYLQQSCHNQNTVLYAISGAITFRALFSADPNEADADQKLIEAIFDVQVADIRDAPLGQPADAIPPELRSTLRGCFRFYFERGQPAQPFP